jgi:hypothetical protein
MPGVAHPHVQRSGFLAHHDPCLIEPCLWPQQSQKRAYQHGDDRQYTPGRQRHRPRTQHFTGRPAISTQQRALDAAQQKSITTDVQPSRRLARH